MVEIDKLIAEDTAEAANKVFQLIYHKELDMEVLAKAYAYIEKHASPFTASIVKLCNNRNANWDLIDLLIKTGPLKIINTPDELKAIEKPYDGTSLFYSRKGEHFLMVVGTEVKNYNFCDENCWYTKYQITEELHQQIKSEVN